MLWKIRRILAATKRGDKDTVNKLYLKYKNDIPDEIWYVVLDSR